MFVNLGTLSDSPEFYIVPSRIVAKTVLEGHANWLKTPGKSGRAHKDNNIRNFHITDTKYLDRWDLLGLD